MGGGASHRYFVRIFHKRNRYFLRRDTQPAKVCMKKIQLLYDQGNTNQNHNRYHLPSKNG